MNLIFSIDYKTVFGEELVLNIVKDGAVAQYHLGTTDGARWTCQLTIPDTNQVLEYYYSVDAIGSEHRHEWTTVHHRLELNATKGKSYTMYDHWSDIPEDAYLYSSAFTDCLCPHTLHTLPASSFSKTVRLIVRAPQLRSSERLAIIGSNKALGAWDSTKAVEMTEHNINEWVVDLNADDFPEGEMEFKFAALDSKKDVTPLWECSNNRTIDLPELKDGEVVVYDLDEAYMPIYNTKIAGTLVPVFSLRSKTSFGVGDFGDLKKMIDYIDTTGQRVLQILPINDSTITHTWTDSYPYSCISVFALHPMYVDLTQLPQLKDAKERDRFEKLRVELNALKQIDYERVNNAKLEYLHLLFVQEGKQMMSSKKFHEFFHETEQWLVPYAQYATLRDKYGTADFSQWPDHNTWNEADRKELSNGHSKLYKEVEFWYFVQYILNTQLDEAHAYARKHHVILKGDIPIGVNRYGCDVWMEPRYFNLNGQAGAPPDDFSVNGQNWGFPTYNWDVMEKDNYAWWMRRFRKMSEYFDAYRIDHILGFFRIWEMPSHAVHGLLGQFVPSLPMTKEEIESFGLRFNERFFTKPYIHERFLEELFGEHTDYVKQTFLQSTDTYEVYDMKPEYATQRQVEAHFMGKTDKNSAKIREGLYSLISDVLFLRDRHDANRFHPRISVQNDYIYQTLSESDKQAFTNLYNHYYYQRHNEFWREQAMKKLPQLTQCTNMLVCGEDLGMIPDCVPSVMNDLRILSLEIQRMPKELGIEFGNPQHYPYRSVCTISTHDMSTLRGWWEEDPQITQRYYNVMMGRSGFAPSAATPQICEEIIDAHLQGKSMLCVPSLQDWLSIDGEVRLPDGQDERINIPAIVKHYWRYRMHLTLEDLLQADILNNKIISMIENSGRD